MTEKILYRVCPFRNVDAAFDCFFGPDSRNLQRFFDDQRRHWADEALYVVCVRGGRALAGTVHGARLVSRVFPKAIEDLNVLLALGWMSAIYALSASTWAAKFLLHRAWLAMKWAAPRIAAAAVAAKELLGPVGREIAHYRLSLFPDSRPVRTLPVQRSLPFPSRPGEA
jgi:hypothetical protein